MHFQISSRSCSNLITRKLSGTCEEAKTFRYHPWGEVGISESLFGLRVYQSHGTNSMDKKVQNLFITSFFFLFLTHTVAFKTEYSYNISLLK